jgi:hypothetical protein
VLTLVTLLQLERRAERVLTLLPRTTNKLRI